MRPIYVMVGIRTNNSGVADQTSVPTAPTDARRAPKGGATNLKVGTGGQCIGRWGGWVNTVKTLTFKKGGG